MRITGGNGCRTMSRRIKEVVDVRVHVEVWNSIAFIARRIEARVIAAQTPGYIRVRYTIEREIRDRIFEQLVADDIGKER